MSAKQDLTIWQGKTFSQVLRWEAPPLIYKPITNILQSAPVRITAVSHGLPNGWRAAVQSVKGMTQINAPGNDKLKASDFLPVTVIDDDTVEFNDINALEYKAYQSGGVLVYNTPVTLTGYTARLSIKDKVGGTELISLTTENNRIVINNTDKTITLQIASADTSLLTFSKAVYDLEMVSTSNVVTGLLYGSVKLEKEVTV